MPECRCTWLYSVKNPSRKSGASGRLAKEPEKSCRYFRVLSCASENGLWLDTRGRE